MHFNQYRYYDCGTGQYVSQDPIGLQGEENPYGYVHNPLSWVDPLGLCKSAPEDKKPYGAYRPDRSLPRDKNGNPIPDVNAQHTQLGSKSGRRGKYTQAREWGYDENGNLLPKRDIDFTDHGRPNEHANPHQHDYIPNPTGGTPQHGPAKPLEIP